MKCVSCKREIQGLKRGRPRKYCSSACYPKQIRVYSKTARCKQCNNYIKNNRRFYCEGCIIARRNARRIHTVENSEKTRRDARLNRERLAPGLGPHQRLKLLKKWQLQSKCCHYCNGKVETVDHIIPLSRGGTNYEGNLIPACRKCNSKKSIKFITEWKFNVGAKAK